MKRDIKYMGMIFEGYYDAYDRRFRCDPNCHNWAYHEVYWTKSKEESWDESMKEVGGSAFIPL
jgi:hypothetical protein